MPAVVEAADSQEGELSCLAHTVYWEAKTEGRNGMVAVAWLILNRMRDGEYPRSVCGYHAAGTRAPWSTSRVRTARIGRHVYYR